MRNEHSLFTAANLKNVRVGTQNDYNSATDAHNHCELQRVKGELNTEATETVRRKWQKIRANTGREPGCGQIFFQNRKRFEYFYQVEERASGEVKIGYD